MADDQTWLGKDISRLSSSETIQFLIDQQRKTVEIFNAQIAVGNDLAAALYGLVGALCRVLVDKDVVTRDWLADEIESSAAGMGDDAPHAGMMRFADTFRSGIQPDPPGRPSLSVIDGGKG